MASTRVAFDDVKVIKPMNNVETPNPALIRPGSVFIADTSLTEHMTLTADVNLSALVVTTADIRVLTARRFERRRV